jgi:hypothetical protein
LFLSVAGDRAHIGTYVGVMPPPASNENNKIKNPQKKFCGFFISNGLSVWLKVIHSFAQKLLCYTTVCGIIILGGNKYF